MGYLNYGALNWRAIHTKFLSRIVTTSSFKPVADIARVTVLFGSMTTKLQLVLCKFIYASVIFMQYLNHKDLFLNQFSLGRL